MPNWEEVRKAIKDVLTVKGEVNMPDGKKFGKEFLERETKYIINKNSNIIKKEKINFDVLMPDQQRKKQKVALYMTKKNEAILQQVVQALEEHLKNKESLEEHKNKEKPD